jgi:nucleotide-binding universal stress UspA family protein
MSAGDVLIMMLSAREDEPVLAAAKVLEAHHDARISALVFTRAVEASEVMGAVYGGVWAEPPRIAAPERPDEYAKIAKRLQRFAPDAPLKQVEIVDGAGADRAGIEARRASMTVILQPGGRDLSFRRTMFESVLYESGRPVLLAPLRWAGQSLGSTIVVAWDGSREVTRAVADASPLLAKAARVLFVTIDAEEAPAADVVTRLRRDGVQCQHRTIPAQRSAIDEVLLRESEAVGADLIVMGGYGHARLHEMLFGGVTRSMVRSSPIPLLLSR